jgi:hypothetical protein
MILLSLKINCILLKNFLSLQVTIKIYKNGSNMEQNFEVKISKNDLHKIKTEVENVYQINYDLKNVFPSEPYNRKNLNKFYKKNSNNAGNNKIFNNS